MWEKVTEEGQEFWINEDLGNIAKVSDGVYITMVPKVCKLGPFSSLEEAKKAAENNELDAVIAQYSKRLVVNVGKASPDEFVRYVKKGE